MTTIISIAIITVVLSAYEHSNLRKSSHITHDEVTGSNEQITVMVQPH